MKKVYLLLTTVIFFASCQKEEISTPLVEEALPEARVKSMEFKELPANIKAIFNAQKSIRMNGLKKKSPFGEARLDVPAKKNIDKKGMVSYTIALKKLKIEDKAKSAPNLYFDNLSITEREDDKLSLNILRYKPEESWYFSSNRLFSSYTGTITAFNIEGEQMGIASLENGSNIPY